MLKEISNVLAIPQPIEEERKYIVKLTGEVPNAIDSDIVQTYLTGEPGSEIRLRRRGFEGGKYVYVHTTKKRISDNEQIETERQINANLYEICFSRLTLTVSAFISIARVLSGRASISSSTSFLSRFPT